MSGEETVCDMAPVTSSVRDMAEVTSSVRDVTAETSSVRNMGLVTSLFSQAYGCSDILSQRHGSSDILRLIGLLQIKPTLSITIITNDKTITMVVYSRMYLNLKSFLLLNLFI